MQATTALTYAERAFAPIGRWGMLLQEAFSTPREYRKYRYNLFRQMRQLGIDSLPIVMLASGFAGAVTTVQADYQLKSPFTPASGIGSIVTASVVLELGVLIMVFMLSGRVGARIAAEIASMRAGEQIEALEVMGINAVGYLFAPRVIAGIVMFPILYVAACIVGIASAAFLVQAQDIMTMQLFLKGARNYFEPYDAIYGATKAVVFGFLLTSISCYTGYRAGGGAEGIGRAATRAAVLSSIYVLLADYVLAEILL